MKKKKLPSLIFLPNVEINKYKLNGGFLFPIYKTQLCKNKWIDFVLHLHRCCTIGNTGYHLSGRPARQARLLHLHCRLPDLVRGWTRSRVRGRWYDALTAHRYGI